MTMNIKDARLWGYRNINRESIDALIRVANELAKSNLDKANVMLDGTDQDFKITQFLQLQNNAREIHFSIYCLATIHIYTLLENNRKQIICGLFENNKKPLSKSKARDLSDIKNVKEILKSIGLEHDEVSHYETSEKFRKLNNKIKHNRHNYSHAIRTDCGKEYSSTEIKKLYEDEVDFLDFYLLSLHQKISQRFLAIN